MDTLIMVLIMTLVLFASSGSSRAATLIVSNQIQRHGNVPVFVTCQGSTLKRSQSINLGQVSLVVVQPTARQNASDAKPAGYRLSQWTSCVGTFKNEAHFWPSEKLYSLYNSDKDSSVSKNVFFVVAKDDGFYRWNNDKNAWDIILPTIWT